MFPFTPSRRTQRLVRRSLTRTTRQIARSVEAATKAATKAATEAVTRSAEQAIHDARRQAARSVKRTVRQAETAMRAAQGPRGPEVVRRPSGWFVTVDGLPVHVIVRGRGRPVVLVHGNGTMAEDFAICGLIERLATRYRVIALDRPGFGYTARPRHRVWTAATQAALLDRILDALKAERPLVVGHSWGTIVSLALAAEVRRELRGLVLLSGYFFPQHRADAVLAAPLAVPGLGDTARALVPAAVNRALAGQAYRQGVPAPAGAGPLHGALPRRDRVGGDAAARGLGGRGLDERHRRPAPGPLRRPDPACHDPDRRRGRRRGRDRALGAAAHDDPRQHSQAAARHRPHDALQRPCEGRAGDRRGDGGRIRVVDEPRVPLVEPAVQAAGARIRHRLGLLSGRSVRRKPRLWWISSTGRARARMITAASRSAWARISRTAASMPRSGPMSPWQSSRPPADKPDGSVLSGGAGALGMAPPAISFAGLRGTRARQPPRCPAGAC